MLVGFFTLSILNTVTRKKSICAQCEIDFLEAAIKRARFYLILMHEQKPIHVLVYRQLRYELFEG